METPRSSFILPGRWIRVFFPLLLVVVTVLLPVMQVRGQTAGGQKVWLPVVLEAWVAPEPAHQGVATYYDADGDGSCMFGASPSDLMVAAMNEVDFNNAAVCGEYIHVVGPKGEVTVRIVDLCPGCPAGMLDMSPQAFALIGSLPAGRVPVTWWVISPDLPGPIVYQFMAGSSRWWTAVQIRNHRNPVASLDYLNPAGQWVSVPRTDYNYFIQTTGMGPGPYTFRVTDRYGNVLIDSGVPLIEGGTVNGAKQFPPGP
jgi:expansin (peptidoglycan-binding protein)